MILFVTFEYFKERDYCLLGQFLMINKSESRLDF